MGLLLANLGYLGSAVVLLALLLRLLAAWLPQWARLAGLAGMVTLAVLALLWAAGRPHDYQQTDLPEVGRGLTLLAVEVLASLVTGFLALAALGPRPNAAGLLAVGLYLFGGGLVLIPVAGGDVPLQAMLAILLGAGVTGASALRLAGVPRWAAALFGIVAGLLVLGATLAVLRGPLPGTHIGIAPPQAATEAGEAPPTPALGLSAQLGLSFPLWLQSCGVLVLWLLFLNLIRVLVARFQRMTTPLLLAGLSVALTGAIFLLRGPGEWAPRPHAPSTTLYGVPLLLIMLAISLAILDLTAHGIPFRLRPFAAGAAPAPRRFTPSGFRRNYRQAGLAVLLLIGLPFAPRPAPDACAQFPPPMPERAAPVNGSSDLTGTGATPRDSGSPRPSPQQTDFDQSCGYRSVSLDQLIYVYAPACKWALVDDTYPVVQAAGTLQEINLSSADAPWIHRSHDVGMDLALDGANGWLVLNPGSRTGPPVLHVEAESGSFPVEARPMIGDRVTVLGRWIYDCGHDQSEIHPAVMVAGEHDEWQSTKPEGRAQYVRVVRIWMNSEPGAFSYTLAPFQLTVAFPPAPAANTSGGQGSIPFLHVGAGPAADVQWRVLPRGTGEGSVDQAAIQVMPPAPTGSAYFELTLGYTGMPTASSAGGWHTYTLAFDQLVVANDLQSAQQNSVMVPAALEHALGLPGSGHWFMDMIVGHTWRHLLQDAPVESQHTYTLTALPPVRLTANADSPLDLAVTGYAENDPSDGVQLAAESIAGAALQRWRVGRLAALCCDTPQRLTSIHGAWTLTYHVTTTGQ